MPSSPPSPLNRKLEWTLLVAILGLAALLRMGWPGLTEFKQDEAHIYKMALDLAELRAWPMRGITYSVGLPESPMSIYLYALPLFVWKSPIMATLWVGALNTLSVLVAYWTVRRYWGGRAALSAALLYATAVWAVFFSRKIWNNNLLPLFMAGYVASGLLAFAEGRTRWLIAHLALWSVAFQLHLSAIACIPVTAALLFVHRRRFSWRLIVGGVAAASLLIAPYAIYLLTRFSDWSRALTLTGGRGLQVSFDSVTMAALLIQGTFLHSLAGPLAYPALRAMTAGVDVGLWLGGVLVMLGLGYVVWQWALSRRAPASLTAAEHTQRDAGLALALWVIVPVLFFIPHITTVYPWYLIILFPTPYLLSGIFVEAVLARIRFRWVRAGVAAFPLLLAASQVWLWFTTLHFISLQNTPGAFGPPLGKLMQVAELARQLSQTDVVIVSAGADPKVDFAPAVYEALLPDVPHRFVDGDLTAVFPAGDAVVVLWPGDYASPDLYRQWGGGQWAATVPLRIGEGTVALAMGQGRELTIPRPREASALLNNGAELLGSGGDAARWELWWRANASLDGEAYQVFAHLLNANGERIAQADQATYTDWHAGDLVISYLGLGSAGTVVRSGMYAYPSLAPAFVLDAQGSPAGVWIEFPLP